ncbi:craniofacial development protein 2-like [Plakobranchus ocellatus]|uniref:Craniofacial development protein 2-like n=1 Tax=Plakobranchus ocellatus TaxID=259542 RepID=A0AAV4B2C2_9GAST|nr:craniofacial development protein 2-like [Plakobranchus ocellatus]
MCPRCVHGQNLTSSGMTSAIINLRRQCGPCNRMAPSQPNVTSTPPIQPTYPFECTCTDFFTHAGHNYLVILNRAEIGVKTVKGLIAENTDPSENLHRAILQYQNTPDCDTHFSPAICLFGRLIRDFIPSTQGNIHPTKHGKKPWSLVKKHFKIGTCVMLSGYLLTLPYDLHLP